MEDLAEIFKIVLEEGDDVLWEKDEKQLAKEHAAEDQE